MSPTLIIAGAGPGLGRGIAETFGSKGFNVALVARNKDRLVQMAKDLSDKGIEAEGFACDLTKEKDLPAVFESIKNRFGPPDVLFSNVVSPPSHPSQLRAVATTPATVRQHFEARVLGTVGVVNQVLPDMIERRSGTIFITTGLSAHVTVPFLTPISMAITACRKYALGLHAETADKGVYVAAVALGLVVAPGDPVGDPNKLGEDYYDLYLKRTNGDVIFGETDVTQEGLDELREWLDEQARKMDGAR